MKKQDEEKGNRFDLGMNNDYKEDIGLLKDNDVAIIDDYVLNSNNLVEEVLTGGKDKEIIASLMNRVFILEKEIKDLHLKQEDTMEKELADRKSKRKSRLRELFCCFSGFSNIIRRNDSVKIHHASPKPKSHISCNATNFVGAGIGNLGNTCFLSAVLQSLTYTVPLITCIMKCSHSSNNCSVNGFCIICTFQRHIENAFHSGVKTIVPMEFGHNLSYFSKFFEIGKEEDSHEFHTLFLGKLDTALSENGGMNFIGNIFGGLLHNKVQCVGCGLITGGLDVFRDLSLGMTGLSSLDGCLKAFFVEEIIHGNEECLECKNCVDLRRRFFINKIPDILIFHMKRFIDVDGFFEKIDTHLEFPTKLDLEPYIDFKDGQNNGIMYDLYAVIVHKGSSIKTGYYFTYVLSTGKRWIKMNDGNVTVASEEEVQKQHAYMLFYSRRGIQSLTSVLESWGCISTGD